VNVYVESNFVLELALLQEQHAACEAIVRLCEAGDLRLILPAYSFMEPFETVRRRQADRRRVKIALEEQFRQLSRTSAYRDRLRDFEKVASLLVNSADEDLERLGSVRSRLLGCTDLVPLESSILTQALTYQERHGLSVQDSVVYASVLAHLERSAEPESCFLNRDLGFGDPEIAAELKKRRCKFLPGFETGLQYLGRPLPGGTAP
jgi:predicted nucleic acid-binding protein